MSDDRTDKTGDADTSWSSGPGGWATGDWGPLSAAIQSQPGTPLEELDVPEAEQPHVAASSGLPAKPAAEQSDASSSDLVDLFAPEPAPTPVAQSVQPAGGPQLQPASEPAPTKASDDSAAAAAPAASGDDLAELFDLPAEAAAEAPAPDAEPADGDSAAESPATADAEPAGDANAAAARKVKRRSLADRRKSLEEAAGDRTEARDLVVATSEKWNERRWTASGPLWGHVERILGYVSTQHDLQVEFENIIITRDPDVDQAQRRRLEDLIRPRLIDANVNIAPNDIPLVFDMVLDEWTGISVLGPLWRDDDITEILIDAWDRVVIERDGALHMTEITFRDESHAFEVARNLSQKVSDRSVNESNPIVTAELPGARLHFNVGKVVRSGLSVAIRKFRPLLGVEKLLEFGAFNDEIVEFLADAIGKGRANVIISGGTGSGKTTMLNAVSSFIPNNERVVTIEDNFELTLQNEHTVALQTKEAASKDSTSNIAMGDLLRSALRMRPDRIVVGEIRGAEAQVMLQAANTGHDGTMSTVHANDPFTCISYRLPDMLQQAREMPEQVAIRQVLSAVDLVVQISKRAGRRFVTEIAAVDIHDLQADGSVELNTLFVGELDENGSPTFKRVGTIKSHTELAIKMADYGADVKRWSELPGDEVVAAAASNASEEPAADNTAVAPAGETESASNDDGPPASDRDDAVSDGASTEQPASGTTDGHPDTDEVRS